MKKIAGKTIIIAAAAGGGLLAALLGVVLLRGPSYAVVYAKGSENLYLAAPKGQFKLQAGASQSQWFSPDGRRLFYDAGGSLLLCEVRREQSRTVAGGVLQWAATDGFALYLEEGGKRLQCYDVRRKTTQALASGVEHLYAANGQSVFFFTKAEGNAEALFRCETGGQPERVAGAVSEAHLYGDTLYYLTKAPTGEASLHRMGPTGGTLLIETGVTGVFWEDYRPGGNLYFLKRGQQPAAAAIELDDPQAESDRSMKEPRQRDFSRIPILGRLLGDGGYGAAMEAYNQKKERDRVRALIGDIMNDLPGASGGRDCYVFDGEAARLLASDVGYGENSVAALRGEGSPAMVYKKEFFEATGEPRRIGLAALAAAYRDGGEDALRGALAALQSEDGAEDLGYTLAMLNGERPGEVSMEQGFGRGDFRAAFLRGTDELLYFERDTAQGPEAMYTFTLTAYGMSERRLADPRAQDTHMTDRGLYYRKNRDLMFYAAGETTRILQNAAAYIEGPDGTLYILANMEDDAGTLYSHRGKTQKVLAENVKLDGVVASQKSGHAAWLANWTQGAGELHTGKKILDTGVTDIILVR